MDTGSVASGNAEGLAGLPVDLSGLTNLNRNGQRQKRAIDIHTALVVGG